MSNLEIIQKLCGLLNELAYTTENHHASSVSADADAVIAALGSGDTPVMTHSTDANS